MKRCPQCARDYNDDSLSFCLDDGSELLFGPSAMDEPATAMLSSPELIEAGTRRFNSDDLTQTPAVTNKPSNGNSVIAVALGFALISALGVGGYIYYGR